MWRFRCDCGNEVVRRGYDVSGGAIKSCGCGRWEALKKQQQPKHGMTGTRLYRIWRGMKKRCYVPGAVGYERYGAMGLEVCEEWKNDFVAFKDWALSHGYDEHLTLDREDNDKGYTPDNCRWVTWVVQENNKRNLLDRPGVREKIRKGLEEATR
jgi:hypothetical protein